MSRQFQPALSVLVLAVAACHGSVHVSGRPHPRPTPLYFESEPNDSVVDADFVSTLAGTQRLTVRGDLQAEYGDVDGFAFVASGPVAIDFVLEEFDLFGDLALCLYDPLLDEYVACYSSILDEKGSFDVLQPGREFHLVVYSEHFDCGSSYELDLFVTPLPYGPETSTGSGTVVPSPGGSDGLRAPARVEGYSAQVSVRPAASERPIPILGQGLRLTLDSAGNLVDLSAGTLVLGSTAR